MKRRIIVPKTGKNIGAPIVEGMEHNDNCKKILEEIAVQCGPVVSVEEKDHFDDDNPVHDSVFNN